MLTKRPENIEYLAPISWISDGTPENVWLGTSVENQQAADTRLPVLLRYRSPVLFASVEPLLGRVYLREVQWDGLYEVNVLTGMHGVRRPLQGESDARINWVIVGGESGRDARVCDLTWVKTIVADCTLEDVPVFVKQLGSTAVERDRATPHRAESLQLCHPKGGDPDEWPMLLRVREWPKPRPCEVAK